MKPYHDGPSAVVDHNKLTNSLLNSMLNSKWGKCVKFKNDMAYAFMKRSEEEGEGYEIHYFREQEAAYKIDAFSCLEDMVSEMIKLSDTDNWQEID